MNDKTPIVIDLQVSDKNTGRALSKLDTALAKIEHSVDRLNDSLNRVADTAGRVSGRIGSMGSRAGYSGAYKSRAVGSDGGDRMTSGQRRIRAYYSAIAGSNPEAALHFAQGMLDRDPWDAQMIRLRDRAQKALDARARKNNPMHVLMQAVMRSRWTNVAGKLVGHPLGVDVLKLGEMFGPGAAGKLFGGIDGGAGMAGMAGVGAGGAAAAALPAVGAVVAATAAITGFVAALNGASGVLRAVGSDYVSAGGSLDTYQGLVPASRFLGGTPGSLASRFQAGISGGAGAAFAISNGINPIGGWYGDMDYSRKLRKGMSAIANSSSIDEARRKADMAGMPELAQLYYLSPGNKASVGEGKGFSEASLKAAANYSFSLDRINNSFSRIGATMAVPALEKVANYLEAIAAAGEGIANIGASPPAKTAGNWAWEGLKQGVGAALPGIGGPIKAAMDALDRSAERSDKNAEALDRNSKAIDENTRVMRDVRETMVGGPGARAKGAVPPAIRGVNTDQTVISHLKLGPPG